MLILLPLLGYRSSENNRCIVLFILFKLFSFHILKDRATCCPQKILFNKHANHANLFTFLSVKTFDFVYLKKYSRNSYNLFYEFGSEDPAKDEERNPRRYSRDRKYKELQANL